MKDVYKEDIQFHDIFGRLVVEVKLAPTFLLEKYEAKIPFDAYFPSLQDKIERRTCSVCHKYHSSIKSLTAHNRAVHSNRRGRGGGKGRRGGRGRVRGRGGGRGSIPDMFLGDEEDDEVDKDYGQDSLEESELEAIIAEEIEDEFDEFEDLGEEPGLTVSIPFNSTLVQIVNLKEWLKSPWTSE